MAMRLYEVDWEKRARELAEELDEAHETIKQLRQKENTNIRFLLQQYKGQWVTTYFSFSRKEHILFTELLFTDKYFLNVQELFNIAKDYEFKGDSLSSVRGCLCRIRDELEAKGHKIFNYRIGGYTLAELDKPRFMELGGIDPSFYQLNHHAVKLQESAVVTLTGATKRQLYYIDGNGIDASAINRIRRIQRQKKKQEILQAAE